MRWRTKTRSDMHSRSSVRDTPRRRNLYLNPENSLNWPPKVDAFELVNFFCHVDMCVHHWYANLGNTTVSLLMGL